jgi:hypothetical protein
MGYTKVKLNKTSISKILTPWSSSPRTTYHKQSAVSIALNILRGLYDSPDELELVSTSGKYNGVPIERRWFVNRVTQSIEQVTDTGEVIKGWSFISEGEDGD